MEVRFTRERDGRCPSARLCGGSGVGPAGLQTGVPTGTDVGNTADTSEFRVCKQAQALAIELSRERRSGKSVAPPPKGRYSERTRQRAIRDLEVGRQIRKRRAAKR